jgi:hypothetical protein
VRAALGLAHTGADNAALGERITLPARLRALLERHHTSLGYPITRDPAEATRSPDRARQVLVS